MKTFLKCMVFTALASASAVSSKLSVAADVPENIQRVLNANGCSGCHARAQTVVGPSFEAIGAKYKASSDALEQLKRKVRAGGSGVWGQVPMPPNAGIGEGDLNAVLDWILQKKPG